MLTEVKNQIKVSFLSIKYAILREMLNKTTFITNVIFMALDNASMIVQWIILYSLKENVGGYTFKQILLLWGLAAGTFGVSRFFFSKAFSLADTINSGKLDAYLVQPKNVLLSVITSEVEVAALGDILYAYIMLFIYGFTLPTFLLFTMFCIGGGIILTAISIILSSLSFWFQKTDIIADTGNRLITSFATYPDGIFKGLAKMLLFTLIPVGIVNYIPVHILSNFNLDLTVLFLFVTFLLISLAAFIFYKGLKRYSSSNLMSARI